MAASPGRERRRRRRGQINVSGSSTVQPITSAIAEAFNATNPDFSYTVDGPGTGDGFKLFCAGSPDIADASRKIKDEEAALCKGPASITSSSRSPIDGISVLTSTANTAVACLSFADLYALIGEQSKGFKTWADAQPLAKELGSNTTFPSGSLDIFGPGEESGTYDSFIELALKAIAVARGQTGNRPPAPTTPRRPTTTRSSMASPIPRPRSAGWDSPMPRRTRTRSARSRSPRTPTAHACRPIAETIASGEYPLSRALYIYVNKAKLADNPALAPFVDYYLADGTISTALETVPYINLAPEELAKTVATWTGSH